jgi:hypothetical protein
MKLRNFIITAFLPTLFSACDFVDVIPDNIPTIDIVFNNRASAEQYLFTCYSYVPQYGNQYENPGLAAGNDTWYYTISDQYFSNTSAFGIAWGLQSAQSPRCDFWNGENGGRAMYKAIRDCNIVIENLSSDGRVSGLSNTERLRWLSEVKVLKAFYHYTLFQFYGPIPIADVNMPITVSTQEARVSRQKVDSVVNYIVQLIDESHMYLPQAILYTDLNELGRLTQAAALSIKAKTLILAASPLFNGNPSFVNFKDHDGEPFINQTPSLDKWRRAAEACEAAILSAENDGKHILYDFTKDAPITLPDSLIYAMNVRQAVTERFNQELVWSCGKQNTRDLQVYAMARLNPGTSKASSSDLENNCRNMYAPTLTIAEMFYSDNGVPIELDTEWASRNQYEDRYKTVTATSKDRFYIRDGQTTARLHFNREPRFYASLGFDRSTWYGSGWEDPGAKPEDVNFIEGRKNEYSGQKTTGFYSITGYYAKKLVSYKNTYNSQIKIEEYPFPIVRLADLYLLHAEALAEVSEDGNIDPRIYDYLRLIRERSGLKQGVNGEPFDIGDVRVAWEKYTTNPAKPLTKTGLIEIIRQERQVELALEGQRYFDLRRWKMAYDEFNKAVRGWSIEGESVAQYYNIKTIYRQRFNTRDYLWPIKDQDLLENEHLIQTYGW